jgi:transposase
MDSSVSSTRPRKGYPSDVAEDEWEFIAPYLALIREDSPQRTHDLREVFNALRYVVRTGIPWRYLPLHFPPWEAVYQQGQRWIEAGSFEVAVHDLRGLLRETAGRHKNPTAAILDGQTIQGTLESGERAGFDGYKMKNGSKVHIAVDTLGNLLTLVVTPADEQERDQVDELCQKIQEVTGEQVKIAWVDQGYTGENARESAQKYGIELCVVRLSESKKGFVLLPRRWVVERSFAWKSRFRRLVRDYERLPETLAGMHYLAFACLMLARHCGHSLWSS